MTLFLPSSSFCNRMNPVPSRLNMSTMKMVLREGSKGFRYTWEQRRTLKSSNSCSHLSVHIQATFEESKRIMFVVAAASSGTQAWNCANRLNSDWRCFLFSGLGNWEITVILSGSGLHPSLEILYPAKIKDSFGGANWNFFGLKVSRVALCIWIGAAPAGCLAVACLWHV